MKRGATSKENFHPRIRSNEHILEVIKSIMCNIKSGFSNISCRRKKRKSREENSIRFHIHENTKIFGYVSEALQGPCGFSGTCTHSAANFALELLAIPIWRRINCTSIVRKFFIIISLLLGH